MKRKLWISLLAICIACLLPGNAGIVYAEDFASDPDYYESTCRQYTEDEDIRAMCNRYRDWLSDQSNDLKNQIAGIESSIDRLKGNIDALQTEINKNQKLIDQLDVQIQKNEEAIVQIQIVIEQLEVDIAQTEADIEKRDRQIKDRMISEQVSIGTNVYVEFIMGAKDLLDMVRIVDGISRITENDQDEIKALEADKEKLDQQKSEQVRLKEDQEKTKKENEENRQVAVQAQEAQRILLLEYRRYEADLNAQMRNAASAQDAIASKIAQVRMYNAPANYGWIMPINNFYFSAGTWYYDNINYIGLHLGLDFAAGIGTPVYAPIGGVIVYANNPAPTNGGYLGNWVGWPYGGGNTIHMVGNVNGTTYAVTFMHLAQENFLVSAGDVVAQGQQIAMVGNAGNSTGAHCHIEVINLGDMSVDDAVAQFSNSGADFAWGTGWNTTSTSCDVRGYAPCRERPEKFFG